MHFTKDSPLYLGLIFNFAMVCSAFRNLCLTFQPPCKCFMLQFPEFSPEHEQYKHRLRTERDFMQVCLGILLYFYPFLVPHPPNPTYQAAPNASFCFPNRNTIDFYLSSISIFPECGDHYLGFLLFKNYNPTLNAIQCCKRLLYLCKFCCYYNGMLNLKRDN